MSFLERLFPKNTPITSASILAERERAESEIVSHRAKLEGAMASIATMTDEQHVAAEASIAATKRAISRLEAKVAHLNDELPGVIAAEEVATQAARDTALRQRAEACRKANTIEAKKLLAEYDKLAAAMGDVFARLSEIADETNAVNAALRFNPIAESVSLYDAIYRRTPAVEAREQRTMEPHWVYRDAPTQRGEIHVGDTEMALLATIDEHGNPVRPGGVHYDRFGRPIQPQLEQREVVRRTYFTPGRYELSLTGNVVLPSAFIGGNAHWPRKS